MSETPDLTFVTTHELIKELSRRHDVGVIGLIKKSRKDRHEFITEFKGLDLECVGLAALVLHEISDQCQGTMEDVEDDS